MSQETFDRILDGLKKFEILQRATFGGFGEPLLHPGITGFVKQIKRYAESVEMITNAMLLSEEVANDLACAGLDVLWVSLDGATPEEYEDIREGGLLKGIIGNLSAARDSLLNNGVHIGISFVAMKRNIRQLPDVIRLGRRLGADRFLVTNIMPYMWEMYEEMLYSEMMTVKNTMKSEAGGPIIRFTRMAPDKIPLNELYRLTRGWAGSDFLSTGSAAMENYCPFINNGSTSISWDGSVSPCLPLMHSYTTILNEQKRSVRRCVFGNINDKSLYNIWNCDEYASLRQRIMDFDFSPCTHCGGCRFAASNEEDCIGNTFPTCGGCLWAQGVIRCP